MTMSEQIENKLVKKKSKKGLFIFLAIVVIILGFVLKIQISNAIEDRNDRIESQTPGEKLIVQTYCQDVESNEKYAEEKYIGNRYNIVGTVTDIDSFGNTTKVLITDSDTGEHFEFTPYNEDDVLALRVGDKVKATGTLNGLFHNYAGYFKKSTFVSVSE